MMRQGPIRGWYVAAGLLVWLAATPLIAAAEPDQSSPRATSADSETDGEKVGAKKPVTIRGCLHGMTLAETEADEAVLALTPSVLLKASKDIRRQLKSFDRHAVELTGVLTPAPRGPLGGRLGGTRITVGGADPRRPIGSQAPPPVASLEVQSVRSLSPTCRD